MNMSDVEERRFLQDRMEGADKSLEFTQEGKRAILSKVIEAEEWEKFLARKYVGNKRFGLDGGESMLPAMESIIKYGGQTGVEEILYGMPPTGRPNMIPIALAHTLQVILTEFSGRIATPPDIPAHADLTT